MDIKLIEEMWETTEGGTPPKDFIATCETYFRLKCVFAPHRFDEGDYAACMLNYKLAKSVQKLKKDLKKDAANG